jgi:hypothetical protein
MSDINAIIFAYFFRARGLNMKDIEEFLHWKTFLCREESENETICQFVMKEKYENVLCGFEQLEKA